MKPISGMPVIVVRADASLAIGGGHVMRCLTLAGALAPQARLVFACRDLPGALGARIVAAGHGYVALPGAATEDEDAEAAAACRAALAEAGITRIDALIVDHYGIDARWMRAMRACARRIVVIDDLADRPLDCDLIVGPSLGVEDFAADYARLAPRDCETMLGAAYALVAPRFAALRPQALDRRTRSWPLRDILVSTGLSDVGGAAVTAARALAGTPWQVRVAIGAAAASMPALAEIAAQHANVTVLPDCSDMAGEMLRTDIMIGAPGTTSWERATLGLPSLLVVAADNQRDIARRLDACGAARVLGEAAELDGAALAAALEALGRDRAAYRAMSTAAARLCAGDGAGRVAARIVEMVN